MKTLLFVTSLVLIPILSFAQNIENKLGASGLFVLQASDDTPLVAISDEGEMTTVGRTNRVITGNKIVLGSVYMEVIDKAQSETALNLEIINAPAIGTEHLFVIKDMKGMVLTLNLVGELEDNHQWISSDTYFDLGGENMLATITNFNTGSNNQITYGGTVTPPGTIIKVIYLGNNLWTATSNFLSTYAPSTNK